MRKRSKLKLKYRPPSCFTLSGRPGTENKVIIYTAHACVFVLCWGRTNLVPRVFSLLRKPDEMSDSRVHVTGSILTDFKSNGNERK